MGVILWCECIFLYVYMRTELLNEILGVVSEVCEVSKDEILSHCKREDVVDARCIFVHFCKEYGFQSNVLMNFLGRKRRVVIDSYVRNYKYYSKQSYMFRLFCSKIADKLSVSLPKTE